MVKDDHKLMPSSSWWKLQILCRDVDFTLDGDLDKLSFKVDMSDLDISSPPKRAGKSKERSKESDGGNQMKQDRFSFPFDFNE